MRHWRLLKWLDRPSPHYDWRARERGEPALDPADEHLVAAMMQEFMHGPTARVLRLPAVGGGYTPIHITANKVELDDDTYAALLSMRLPTDEELAASQHGATVLDGAEPTARPTLKSILRIGKSAESAD